MHAGGCTLNQQKHSSPGTPCSGGSGAQQYPSGRLATSSAPQPSMAELMAEIAANEYAASGGGGPLVQRAAQVGPAAAVLANVQSRAAPHHTCRTPAGCLSCMATQAVGWRLRLSFVRAGLPTYACTTTFISLTVI